MSQPAAVYRGFGLGEFHKAQFPVHQLLQNTFPAPLLAPSQVLGLRNALQKLSDLISRLLKEGADPYSDILRYDSQPQTNLLLAVAGIGLVETLENLKNLVHIQEKVHDGSELRWHGWVASLNMAGILGEEDEHGDGEGEGETLGGLRRRLEEAVWRVECLFKVLIRSNTERILDKIPAISNTLNAVLVNHQLLYFPSSRDNSSIDDAGIRVTLYSELKARFGYWGSPRSDAMSEISVRTTTTTEERIYRNREALDIDAMIEKFQEAAAGGRSAEYTTAPAQLAWRTRADSALVVLMHWVHQAITGLQPFIQYHSAFPKQAQTPGLNVLPVPGYVNLIKSAWILQTLHPEKGALGQELESEGKALYGLIACEVIDLFQSISEREYDLPSTKDTLDHGNFNITFETSSSGQRTPTLSSPTQGITQGLGITTDCVLSNINCNFTVDRNQSSGSSSGASAEASITSNGASEPYSKKRGRSVGPKGASEADSRKAGSRPSSTSRGRSVSGPAEGRGRPRGHWRSISSSITGSGDREKRPASLQISPPVVEKAPQEQHGPGLRRPSTAASTSSTRTATNSIGNSYTAAFSKVFEKPFFAPFSTSTPSGRGAFGLTGRTRSRSVSPTPPRPVGEKQRSSQSFSQTTTANHSTVDLQGPASPTSIRSNKFPKLQFPTSKDRGRSSHYTSSSVVSLISSSTGIADALVERTKGVYATKPLPPVPPLPTQPCSNMTGGNVPGEESRNFTVPRAAEAREGVSRSVFGRSEASKQNKTSVNGLGARDGEVEVMPTELSAMSVVTSYSGDFKGDRWDECRIRIFTKPAQGPNGEYGTKLRLVTVNTRMEGVIDQRTLFLEHCELVPEYYFHDSTDSTVPIIYIRKIAPPTTTSRQSKRHSSTTASTLAVNSSTATKVTSTQWDFNSLYYKFKTLRDIFIFQLAFLGESVEMDKCSIPTIRLKRHLLDGEHVYYRARIQIWQENANIHLRAASEIHAANKTNSPPPTTRSNSKSNESNCPPANPLLKIYDTRIVIAWENGGGLTFLLTEFIDIEQRTASRSILSSSSSASSITAANNNSNSGGLSPGLVGRRPSTINTHATHTTTNSTDAPMGNYVLRIKPYSKLSLNQGSIKARLLSPGSASGFGLRLDKQGLRYDDCENGDSWDDYRWVEIEFRTGKEMTVFQDQFKRLIEERKEKKKRIEDSSKSSQRNSTSILSSRR